MANTEFLVFSLWSSELSYGPLSYPNLLKVLEREAVFGVLWQQEGHPNGR